jgi:uncharacterized protein (DUF2236 family)
MSMIAQVREEPAPLTPDTLRFIRYFSQLHSAKHIAEELHWPVERLQRTVHLRIPGLRLLGETPINPKERKLTEDFSQAIARARLGPASREVALAIRQFQVGERGVRLQWLAKEMRLSTRTISDRVRNARLALIKTRFSIETKRGSDGGYRIVEVEA